MPVTHSVSACLPSCKRSVLAHFATLLHEPTRRRQADHYAGSTPFHSHGRSKDENSLHRDVIRCLDIVQVLWW